MRLTERLPIRQIHQVTIPPPRFSSLIDTRLTLCHLLGTSRNIGPQNVFPIPRGIVDTAGSNTIVLSLWGMDKEKKDLEIEDVRLSYDGAVQGGVGEVALANPKWEKRDSF